MESDDVEQNEATPSRVKRFTHKSYNQQVKEVHLPSTLTQTSFDRELADNESHFHEALDHWRQLNLSPGFLSFAHKADSLSASMPLLLHNWREITDLWVSSLESSDDEGLRALLDLLQKMTHDLRTTLSPVYPDLLNHLLKLLPRSISAPALTELLSTFSSLFKYLLVPSIDLNLLEQTWLSIHQVLTKCVPEVQRVMAEVWASVLRRLKPTARKKAAALIATDVTGIENSCAWMFTYACQSVSQTLHTATTSIITPLLLAHLSCGDPIATFTLIRRVLTALIHHVKSADQFAALGDLLVAQFTDVTDSATYDEERLRRMLEIIAVPCAVRHGSRLSEKQLSTLVSKISSFPVTENLHIALLKFAASVLMAGNIALWTGPGRKMIDRSWEWPDFGVKLCGALADLGWGGWKMVALPTVLKLTPQLLEKDPGRTVRLLATLHREKRLGEVDLVWKQRLESWVKVRLTDWERSEETVTELEDILALSSLFPSISPLLIQIINVTLKCPQPTADFETSYANSAWVLGACMQGLTKLDTSAWVNRIDLASWTRTVVDKWGWSDVVLGGLTALIQTSSSEDEATALDVLYPSLHDSLLSHSRSLRLSALRLLSSKAVKSSGGELEVLKRCLQGEMVSVDVQGVRERVLRIGRVSQVVKDDIGADICARWLIAQLKVNLRPLWSSAGEALALLSQRFGDCVWRLVFSELCTVSQTQQTNDEPRWMGNGVADGDKSNDPWEEERSWRDPSAHKLRSAIMKWIGDDRRVEFLQNRNPRDRFDSQSYELQLLSTLRECSSLAERHNRDIVPLFLSLVSSNTDKISRQTLGAWLTLFAKFANPKALHSTDTLRTFYISLLSHPDRSIQTLSVSCLFTYKSAHLVPHQDRIRALLDDTRWRDELTALDIGSIEPQDRSELVDVVIRLLFGLMLEKRGRSRGNDRRAAILGTLGGCTDQELGLLVDLMLKPINSHSSSHQINGFVLSPIPDGISEKQQVGFLTLLGDVLKHLGPRLTSYWPALLGTTLNLIGGSQTRIETASHGEVLLEDVDGDEEEEEEMGSSSKITRSVRQLGLKRFADFFRSPVTFDYTPFVRESFPSFISARLDSLDKENTQAPSALLELFCVWTSQHEYVKYLVDFDARTVPKIYDCLVATSVKPDVISRIYDIVDRLLVLSAEDSIILETVLKPHMSLLLTNLSLLVERTRGVASVSSPLGQRQIGILSDIAQYSTDVNQASTLLGLFSPLLRRPPKMVPEKVKMNLLKILGNLLALIPDLSDRTTPLYTKTYELLSQLFQSLRSRAARLELVSAFQRFAFIDPSLQPLASLLESLNAYSSRRMDEPDFDRRLNSFASLNETLYKSLSIQDWLPLLYNMLHFIQDPTELAVRSNASFALRHFVDFVSDVSLPEYEQLFLRMLYPGIKNGLRSRNEMVRTEVLGVLAYAVTQCTQISSLQEMRVLLAAGDEEASFFNNIHHVQTHRRTRALRRLADQCDEGRLSSNTLTEIFVPLVANYITTTASLDHHLVNEAVVTMGRMAKHLGWGAYYALVQKYLRVSRARDESERVYVRTLVAVLDNFHFPMEEVVPEVEKPAEDDSEDTEEDHDTPLPLISPNVETLGRIADSVNLHLLPNLLQHLEKHDATTEDITRIPIAIGIVKVAKHLPAATREPQISRLLTILSQILRSQSQDTRNHVRDTLCRMAVNLGPSYLPLMLREMRAALLRGPQLHVLAYVTHALLVYVTTGEHAGSFHILDECVNEVAYISAEVVFGESGKDVQSEEFKTKMREVRSSSAKGLDSFSIMAKNITPPKISSLLMPLRSIMQETESVKVMQLVDDVLRRIATGLNANDHLVPSELLVLCHTLISQNARFLKHAPTRRKGPTKGDAIVQITRHVVADDNHYSNNSFRFIAFGLDLLNTAWRRNRFDFRDASIMARLESMVVVVGNTLYSSNTPVLILGLKSIAAIVKCPLKSMDKSLPVFLRQIMDIVRQTGTTESDIVQAAFKALATIFRDCPSAQVKEKDLVYLLELLSPDLEEPLRQAAVFTVLRAIVSRRFVVPEMYDLMDKVSEIMVTNQSPQVQELCRGVLLQFLLDYPQGKGRLRNQMTFLAKNLSYVYESGRKSVMELLAAMATKFEVSLVREYADLMFVALVMVIANDDSAKCREMASELIKTIFARLDDDHRRMIMSHLHSWSTQHSQPQLTRVSSQVYGLIIEVLQSDALPYTSTMFEDLNGALELSAQQFASIEKRDQMNADIEWQVPYHALSVLSKILQVFPNLTTTPAKIAWSLIVAHLLFTHAWVRTVSCRLLGLLFTAVPVAPPSSDLSDDSPLSRIGMQDVAKRLCLQLKSEHLDAPLSLQIVKNLFYIGKCLCAIPVPQIANTEEAIDEEFDEEKLVEESQNRDPLPWLFSKLSYQIKSAHIARRNRTSNTNNWSHQPLSILRWFAAMASYIEPARLESFLVHILTPLYRITEDDTIRDSQMDELKTLANELQELVQSKVGITKFSNTYNRIRQSVLGVQRERKAARVMQAKTNPEAAAKRKLQRNIIKKGSRKRKNTMFAESKGRTKRRREE